MASTSAASSISGATTRSRQPGATAFALLPFITLPTDRNNGISPDGVEGGLILPFAVKLSDKFGLGLNAGVHVVRNDGTPGHHAEYLASASLSYEWSEAVSTYYEVAARFNTGNPLGDVAVLATGFTYKLSKNLQFDGGVRFGVTEAADRFSPFFGGVGAVLAPRSPTFDPSL